MVGMTDAAAHQVHLAMDALLRIRTGMAVERSPWLYRPAAGVEVLGVSQD